MKLSFASGGTLLDEACWRVGGGGPLHAIGLEMGRITSAVALYLPRCVWAWGGKVDTVADLEADRSKRARNRSCHAAEVRGVVGWAKRRSGCWGLG